MKNSHQNINQATIGKGTTIYDFVNIYGCSIGKNCMIGSFVEIQEGVVIGDNVKVESHAFICSGVQIATGAFIGHHVVFTNDRYPRSVSQSGALKKNTEWKLEKTLVGKNASIGSNVTILPGLTIGRNAIVGAGSVVTKDVPQNTVVVGNPARVLRKVRASDEE